MRCIWRCEAACSSNRAGPDVRRLVLILLLIALPLPSPAAERLVPAEPGALLAAIKGAATGDVLRLAAGLHQGAVIIDRPLTLDGGGSARIDGSGS